MTTIPFDSKGSMKIIAHRGLSGLERENTCAAFVAAGVKSYWGIETDVHVTRDGRYVIIHDDTTLRVTGKDYVVSKTKFKKLRKLKILDTDKKTERGDLIIPTLDEYLSVCKKYEKVSVLELKEEIAEEYIIAIANAVKAFGLLESTVFISFSKNNLLAFRRNFPTLPAQYLSYDISKETIKFLIDNNLDADIEKKAITKDFVEKMHRLGKTVNAWTVNTLEDAQKLRTMGVDMITTNILE